MKLATILMLNFNTTMVDPNNKRKLLWPLKKKGMKNVWCHPIKLISQCLRKDIYLLDLFSADHLKIIIIENSYSNMRTELLASVSMIWAVMDGGVVCITLLQFILIALLELGFYPVITNHLRFTPAIFPWLRKARRQKTINGWKLKRV